MRKSGKRVGLIGAALLATSCYGPFNLTNRLHHWNGLIGDPRTDGGKWVNETVFFGCAIVPVYAVCLMGDCLVFNSVEFWSGKNWVSAPGD